jgi:hypothetical protein
MVIRVLSPMRSKGLLPDPSRSSRPPASRGPWPPPRPLLGARLSLTACLLLAAASAGAAIVDPLAAFKEDELGWSGSADASYSASGGNTRLTTLTSTARLQWQDARERFRLLGNLERKTSESQEIARSLMAHLRHNHRLDDALATLAFVQFQENPFQRLQGRTLIGGGLRLDLLRQEESHLSWGVSDMLEIERLDGHHHADRWHRLSTFLEVRHAPREHLALQLTVFLQPRWSEPGDYRLLLTAGTRVRLAGPVVQITRFTWERDSMPPMGVKKDDWELSAGLGLEL